MSNKTDSPIFHSTIFKILLLHLGTSVIFLGIIFFAMYEKGLQGLRFAQMQQMRNDYLEIATNLYENHTFAQNISSETHTPFAILESKQVVFSNLALDSSNIASLLESNKGFFEKDGLFFVEFGRNKDTYRLLVGPHSNLSKRQKQTLKELDKQKIHIVMQGEIINSAHLPFFGDKPRFEQSFEPLESISTEIFKLRLEIVLYLAIALCVVGIVAYFLVQLSLRPIREKVQTLERFIKDSTHEINTPLSVILMSVQKFDTTNLSESNRKKLTHIKLSAQNLNHLYQNLIFFNFYSKIGIRESIDLKALITQRIEYFSPLLAQKSISLESNLSDSKIYANTDEMTIVIDNLLSNAIKFNHKNGEIKITLDVHFLSIQDNGYGIEPKMVSKIFERYSRFNDAQGGFGIGLSLVKEICHRYGIQISCESQIDKGSTFSLRWD